jgi:pimeloyl-ACP methyl ester carboxylesterase
MSFYIDKIIAEIQDNFLNYPRIRKISKRFFHGGYGKLYVINPYWHASLSELPIRLLKRRILKAGYSCLIYQFPGKILSENIHLTEKYFKEIQEEIRKDVKHLKNKHNFREVIVIGMSLGCINALMVANKNPDVNKVSLVVPGDSLADSLWRSIGTKKLKNKIKMENVNLRELEKDWQCLDPKNNIDGLFDKEIEIYLSRSDKVIPYENGGHLIKDMKNIGLNPIFFKNNKLGHYLTIFEFIISKKF